MLFMRGVSILNGEKREGTKAKQMRCKLARMCMGTFHSENNSHAP